MEKSINKANKIIEQAISETKKKKEKVIEKPRLLTGSTLLDIILGGAKNVYGIQTGVIWNSIGQSGGGKTFNACELVAINKNLYKDKFKWFFDDAELGNAIDSKKLYGFEIVTEEMKEKASSTVEDLHMNIKKFIATLKPDEMGCYIIDSLDALVSSEIKSIIVEREKAYDKGKDFDKGSYFMEKAKYLKQQFFPDIKPLIEKSNCLLIITSQQSEQIGMTFGSSDTRAGGKALKFFAHFESWMKEVEKFEVVYKGEKRIVGVRNKIKFTKTRNQRPFRSCYSTIFFEYGVADLDSNLDYLFNLLTDSGKTSANFNVEYKDQVFKKKKDLIKFIEDNNLEQEIKQAVVDKWENVEDAVKIERKRKF